LRWRDGVRAARLQMLQAAAAPAADQWK